MNLIRLSIERPMAIVAMVLMIVLFGYVALQRIPIQMAPDVRQPVLIVTTNWRGAAPAEVEREIVIPQEDELKRLEGVQRVLSEASHGRGKITLEFSPGVNFDRMLLLVSNRLDRVSNYPEEAEEPILGTSGTEDNAIGWFVFTPAEGNDRSMIDYGDFLRDVVQERLERVPGIGGVNIFGETEREMQIVIDPERLARYRLTVGQVVNRLRAANASVTGGDIDEGKRRYVVRTEGDFAATGEVEAVVLRSNARGAGVGRVTVGDIATVTLAYKEPRARLFSNGVPALGLNLTREQGANVIETMKLVQETMGRLRDGPIEDAGLRVRQVYDETDYINSSIDLVMQNIYFGGALAIMILLLFLRSWRPTAVVAVAIPVSVVGSFVAMALLGRSLNVISLAGIAFAVGMVVDAAIVVLENIYRLRQGGMSRAEAAYRGTAQIWPAVLVSSLTTVMVFIPILIMDLEVGQLFRDIAVAISVSVLLSLLVSVTLIPALSNRMLTGRIPTLRSRFRLPVIDSFGRGFGPLLALLRAPRRALEDTGAARGRRHHGGRERVRHRLSPQARLPAGRQPQFRHRFRASARGLQSRHDRNHRPWRAGEDAQVLVRCGARRDRRQTPARNRRSAEDDRPVLLRRAQGARLHRRASCRRPEGARTGPHPATAGPRGTGNPRVRVSALALRAVDRQRPVDRHRYLGPRPRNDLRDRAAGLLPHHGGTVASRRPPDPAAARAYPRRAGGPGASQPGQARR